MSPAAAVGSPLAGGFLVAQLHPDLHNGTYRQSSLPLGRNKPRAKRVDPGRTPVDPTSIAGTMKVVECKEMLDSILSINECDATRCTAPSRALWSLIENDTFKVTLPLITTKALYDSISSSS